jgi:hypothetical protein
VTVLCLLRQFLNPFGRSTASFVAQFETVDETWMHLMIQRQNNNLTSGSARQKVSNTEVSLQGDGICFLGQRWDAGGSVP